MADLSLAQVKAILAEQGIAGVPEDEFVETTRRLNALTAGLDRLEESGAFGDLEAWALFDPNHGSE